MVYIHCEMYKASLDHNCESSGQSRKPDTKAPGGSLRGILAVNVATIKSYKKWKDSVYDQSQYQKCVKADESIFACNGANMPTASLYTYKIYTDYQSGYLIVGLQKTTTKRRIMSKLKNKFVELLASLVASTLQQSIVQEGLFRLINQYLQRNDSQGNIDRILDEYLLRDISKSVLCKAIAHNAELQKVLWKASNIRPTSADMHWASIPNSIREQRMIQATIDAGKFVQKNIPSIEGKPNAFETLKYAIKAVSVKGLYLEFGVFSGTTINYISNIVGDKITVHGFDSFEGLPEEWGALAKGTFDTKGQLPKVNNNVLLHKGWFDKTIAPFLENNQAPIAFLHADADLYSSTSTILMSLKERIVKGTIIVFDELINYPYWRDHEYKAFMEFIEKTGNKFEYIAYTDRGYSVAVKIL